MKDIQIKYGERFDDRTIYRVKGNPRSFCITGSPLGNWTQFNEEYLRLEDDGNGITVHFSDSLTPVRLDYCQAEILRLALKINSPKGMLSEITERPFKGL